MDTQFIILGIVALAAGLLGGYYFRKVQIEKFNREAIERVKKKVEEEERRAKEMVLEAKNEALKIREEAQREEQQKRHQLEQTAETFAKEESLDKKDREQRN